MNLFELKNNKLVISPESLALKPFKELWERDTTKDKSKAIAEISLVYYMSDYKSDFQNILDEKQRFAVVQQVLDLKDWKPDATIIDAMQLYKELQETPSMKILASAKNALSKLQNFFNIIDLGATDKSGKPKYNPKQLADTVAVLPKLIAGLNSLEDQVKKEVEAKNNKLRGGRDKGNFAD